MKVESIRIIIKRVFISLLLAFSVQNISFAESGVLQGGGTGGGILDGTTGGGGTIILDPSGGATTLPIGGVNPEPVSTTEGVQQVIRALTPAITGAIIQAVDPNTATRNIENNINMSPSFIPSSAGSLPVGKDGVSAEALSRALSAGPRNAQIDKKLDHLINLKGVTEAKTSAQSGDVIILGH